MGQRLRATVTAKNSVGSTSATSAASDVVAAAGVAPQNTARPSLSGISKEGQTLTVCCGSWSGTQPITLAFRWVRCGPNGAAPCDPIAGATQQSYTLTIADIGRTVQAFVDGVERLRRRSRRAPRRAASSSGRGRSVP